MKAEVAILYADLSIVRVSWDEKHSLPRENIEAIAVIGEQWRQCSILHDFYYLVWTDTDCNLSGHDGDFGFYPFDGREADWRFPFILPDNTIEFTTENALLNKAYWKRAQEIYNDPDGGMY